MAQVRPEDAAAGQVPAADLEDALFGALRQQLESMISWAKSDEALALEHDQFESRTLTEGFEVMRIFTEAHMGLRTAREQRRTDVADAGGNLRVSTEDGQEHTRMMVYGPVRTSRIAYKRYRRPNLYPQDADLNWATEHSYSAGVVRRVAKAAGVVPFAQAAAQVSEAGAITIGKRQAEQLAIGAAIDFEAFYAARRPEPSPAGTGLLITADGSAFSVRPEALRPATAKAARARQQAACGWPDDPGELRKSKKRSAELAGVADIPPAPRTASDIIAALFETLRDTGRRAADGDAPRARHGPKAEGKTVLASARKPIPVVVGEAFAEAARRDPGHLRPWFAVVDGNNTQIGAIRAYAAQYQVNVLTMTDQERETLQRWARRPKSAQQLALRSKIVLACAEGKDNKIVAAELGAHQVTVGKWRSRFLAHRLEGLTDEDRPGRPRTITDDKVEEVIVATLERPPANNDSHWSTRSMAKATGMSQTAVSRIWRAFELKPHREQTWKLSADPQFIEKVRDVVGLYMSVRSCVRAR